MGGGAAMRTATKVAGVSSFTSAFCSGNGPGLMDNPMAFAAKRIISRIPATVGNGGFRIDDLLQRPADGIDEWEFANVIENEQKHVKDNVEVKSPRVVFGHVPTIEETKKATCQLKHAIDKAYFSSAKYSESEESLAFYPETNACTTQKSSVPKGAMQAFRLLNENPLVQSVVASIASDPNVWLAVMQNPAFVDFLESERNYFDFETSSVNSGSSPRSSIDNAEESGFPDSYKCFVKEAKVTIADIVNKLTSFVEGLFYTLDAENRITYDSPKTIAAGGTFMALAMMVIMVVLMKRN